MRLRHDRRGQSVVVGTVVLFGFLILAMALYQVQVVPADNRAAEIDHSQTVEAELLDLRNAIERTRTAGAPQPESVGLGMRYPSRLFFVNPPPVSGEIASEPASIHLDNVEPVRSGNVREFWNVVDTTFDSRAIRYSPGYNEYTEGPDLVYEHSVVAAEFDDALVFRSNQTVVRDTRISLTAVSGDVDESGVEARSIDPDVVSRNARTVSVTGEDGEDIELAFETTIEDEQRLEAEWRDRVRSEYATVDVTDGEVRITLDGDQRYQLRMAEITLDGSGTADPAYLVATTGTGVVAGQSFGVEVRDRYNNPVENAAVSIDGETFTTDDDGRVFVEAASPGTIEATLDVEGEADSHESVTFEVVESTGALNRTFDTEWVDSGPVQVLEGGTEELNVTVTDRDTGTSVANATIDYSIAGDPEQVSLSALSQHVHDGEGSVTFDAGTAPAGAEFDVYAAAGDDADRVTVEIVTSQFQVAIEETNEPVTEGETLTVTAVIENTGEHEGTQDIDLHGFDDTVVDTESDLTLEGGESRTVELDWHTEAGDAGTGEITVRSDDDSDTTTVSIEEEAATGPTIEEFDAQSQEHPQHARFDVNFRATAGDAGITGALLELVDPETETVVDTWEEDYAEATSIEEDLTPALEENGGAGDDYVIRLTVSDGNDNEAEEQLTRTA